MLNAVKKGVEAGKPITTPKGSKGGVNISAEKLKKLGQSMKGDVNSLVLVIAC